MHYLMTKTNKLSEECICIVSHLILSITTDVNTTNVGLSNVGNLCFFSFNELACKHNQLHSLTNKLTNPTEKKTLQLMTLSWPI